MACWLAADLEVAARVCVEGEGEEEEQEKTAVFLARLCTIIARLFLIASRWSMHCVWVWVWVGGCGWVHCTACPHTEHGDGG